MGKAGSGPKRHPAHIKMRKGEANDDVASRNSSSTGEEKPESDDGIEGKAQTSEEKRGTKRKDTEQPCALKKPKLETNSYTIIKNSKPSSKVTKPRKLKKRSANHDPDWSAVNTKPSSSSVSAAQPCKTGIFSLLDDFRSKHAALKSPHLSFSVVDSSADSSPALSPENSLVTITPTSEQSQVDSSGPLQTIIMPVPVKIVPATYNNDFIVGDPAVAAASSLLQLAQAPSPPVESVLPDVVSDHMYSSPVPAEILPSIATTSPHPVGASLLLPSNCDMESRNSCAGHSILPNNESSSSSSINQNSKITFSSGQQSFQGMFTQ